MSAQIIAALQLSAARLDVEAAQIRAVNDGTTHGLDSPTDLKAQWREFLAAEFRQLADTAQRLP